jgi:predicted nucleic acid-binding protein
VTDWLSVSVAWIPEPGERHTLILGELVIRHDLRGNLVHAQLAALALQHDLTVYSADTDFARFTDVRWENPLA